MIRPATPEQRKNIGKWWKEHLHELPEGWCFVTTPDFAWKMLLKDLLTYYKLKLKKTFGKI